MSIMADMNDAQDKSWKTPNEVNFCFVIIQIIIIICLLH